MRLGRLTFRGLAALAAAVGGVGLFSASALGRSSHVWVSSFPGALSGPLGVALDRADGDLYVADSGNHRVQKYDPSGAFVLMFGGGVDQSTGGSVCTAASGDTCGVGAPGPGAGLFDVTYGAAVDNSGGGSAGAVYVTDESTVQKFDSSGALVSLTAGSFVTTGGAAPLARPIGVAVDPSNGDVYVGDYENNLIDVFDASGGYIAQFGSGLSGPVGISIDTHGNVYVVNGNNGTVSVSSPSSLPVTAGTTWSASVLVDGSGAAQSAAVDTSTDDLYVNEGGSIVVYGPAGAGPTGGAQLDQFPSAGIPAGAGVGIAINDTTGNGNSGYVYAGDSANSAIEIFKPAVLPDVVTGTPATNITPVSATLSGTVNPDGIDAQSQFEYGTSPALGSTVTAVQGIGGPDPGSADDGAGASAVPVTANLPGLAPNTTYYYRLDASNVSGLSRGQIQTFTTAPPILPVVDDQQPHATNVTRMTVELSGTINPEYTDTHYHFVYGPTTSYGHSTPDLDGGAGLGDKAVGPVLVRELLPGTTYHYALVATNQGGAVVGQDAMFTTAAATPPAVTTGPASDVAQYTATISGTIGTQGLATVYGFDIATDTNYGPDVIVASFGGSVTQAIAIGLQGLQPGTTYHYRIFGASGGGVTYGEDRTFTTSGFPDPLTVLLSPPLLAAPTIAFPPEAKLTFGSQKQVKVRAKAKSKRHKRGKPKHKKKR